MVRFTITPWRTQADLLSVRSQLYHLDQTLPDCRRTAVNRVMAWKLRGNLPHAVESTALLVDALLHHSIPGISIFSIRAVYSAAFTRFVTGFCDIGRNKERSLEPSSMLDIAKQIGMPTHFVALRHEATHEELPNLTRIVKASEEALKWLWNVYWSRLQEVEREDDVMAELPLVRTEAKELLKTFRRERLEALKSKRRKDQIAALSHTANACCKLMGAREEKTMAVADVLIEEKLLSPSKRVPGSSLEGAFLIWDDLLIELVLMQKRFLNVFVKRLLQAVVRPMSPRAEDDVEKEAFSVWLLHVFKDENWVRTLTSPEHRVLLRDVLQWCCLYPCSWTQSIGEQLLEDGDGDLKEEWYDILEASRLEEANPVKAGSDLQVPTLTSDVSEETLLERLEEYQPSRDVESSRSWMRGPIPRNTPIGVVAR